MGNFFYDEAEEYRDTLREQAQRKAEFCLVTGIAPSEYDNLTQIEIQEFVKQANRMNKRGG